MSGNPVSCAAAIATLDIIDKENLADAALKMGSYLKSKLENIKKTCPSIVDVRGLGLMIGVEFSAEGGKEGGQVKKILEQCANNGLILISCGPLDNVIRFIPPLIVTKEQIDSAVNIFEEALKELR